MGDLEGVGRIYRPELNPNVARSPKIDRAGGEKQRKGKEEGRHEDEPHDTIDLHELEEQESGKPAPLKKPVDAEGHLDISA